MSKLDNLQDCPLHRKTVFGIRGVSQSQFSVARYYGGCQFNNEHYIYDPTNDELIRQDVLKWVLDREKKAKPKKSEPEPVKQDELF